MNLNEFYSVRIHWETECDKYPDQDNPKDHQEGSITLGWGSTEYALEAPAQTWPQLRRPASRGLNHQLQFGFPNLSAQDESLAELGEREVQGPWQLQQLLLGLSAHRLNV